MCDRSDDQRGRVFTSIIQTGTEVWIEFLSEGAASERVDMRPGLHIIKGDQTLLIVHKHPHLLGLLSQGQGDRGASQSPELISIPQTYSPVSINRGQSDDPLPVDGLSGHSQIHISLPLNLHLIVEPP